MYHLTAHLRMNAVYWGLTALCIMKQKDALDREEMIDFVMSCWDEEAGTSSLIYSIAVPELQGLVHDASTGAFGASPQHDAHLLPTLSAIQILVMQDALERVDIDRVTRCQFPYLGSQRIISA